MGTASPSSAPAACSPRTKAVPRRTLPMNDGLNGPALRLLYDGESVGPGDTRRSVTELLPLPMRARGSRLFARGFSKCSRFPAPGKTGPLVYWRSEFLPVLCPARPGEPRESHGVTAELGRCTE